jgi:hypothetical protein
MPDVLQHANLLARVVPDLPVETEMKMLGLTLSTSLWRCFAATVPRPALDSTLHTDAQLASGKHKRAAMAFDLFLQVGTCLRGGESASDESVSVLTHFACEHADGPVLRFCI